MRGVELRHAPDGLRPRVIPGVRPTGTQRQVLKKPVILSVRADPEPSDLIILEKPEGTESEGHAHRVNGLAIVNLLEVEARMPSVLAEEPVCLP